MAARETGRGSARPATALDDAVAEAYRVFGRHRAPTGMLDVCTACCVDESVERELRTWPLARLTANHLYQYNDTAKSELQPVPELAYLLPRMLELLAAGEPIHHSLELSLNRLGRCPPSSWDAAEQRVLDAFAAAYFDRVLSRTDLEDGRAELAEDPFDVLVMFDIGGLAIAPLLERWLQCEAPVATLRYVEATYWHFWETRTYENAFASDRTGFKAELRDWLLDAEHRQRFAAKLLAPSFLAAASRRACPGRMPFGVLVDAVFDELAS